MKNKLPTKIIRIIYRCSSKIISNSGPMSFTKSDEFYHWRSAITLQTSHVDFFWFATSHTYHEALWNVKEYACNSLPAKKFADWVMCYRYLAISQYLTFQLHHNGHNSTDSVYFMIQVWDSIAYKILHHSCSIKSFMFKRLETGTTYHRHHPVNFYTSCSTDIYAQYKRCHRRLKKPTMHTQYMCTTIELALLVKKISERAEIPSTEIF